MKVLGLVGSGRKDGNTNTLVTKILEGANASGHETQKVLADFNVSPIGDCAPCRKVGHCLIEDDFDALLGERTQILMASMGWWPRGLSARLITEIIRL